MPEVLSLAENYNETAGFLLHLRDGLTGNWQRMRHQRGRPQEEGRFGYRTYWDFTTIRRIAIPVALMIASEYDRVRRSGLWRPHAIDYDQWDPHVRSMLDQIGFLSMCGVEDPEPTILKGDGWRLLRFESGTGASGERVGDLLLQLGLDAIVADPTLYEAVVEALANTRHHAYPGNYYYPPPHVPGWWMTGAVDEGSKSITLVVYDHGVTIPVSLADPRNDWALLPKWRQLLARLTGAPPTVEDTDLDGVAIAAAIKVGTTSTGLSFRGRGLKSLEIALDMCKGGEIAIRSRHGEYRKKKGGRPEYMSHPVPVNGTLVAWHLEL